MVCAKYPHPLILLPCIHFVDTSTLMGNCRDGEVQLVGGVNRTLGRLEVCVSNAWGTVCNRRFGTNEALVVCQQLGFATGEMVQII